jgi:hypothetical protein
VWFTGFCLLFAAVIPAGLKEVFKCSKEKDLGELLAILMVHQKGILDVLELDFNYWRGSSLSEKEMEHALCEFAKFTKLVRKQGDGGRHYSSRASLGVASCCSKCKNNIGKRIGCCTCPAFFCQDCVDFRNDSKAWEWICPECLEFESKAGK